MYISLECIQLQLEISLLQKQMELLILYYIYDQSDASIKHAQIDTGGNSVEFTLGIPISGIHIEDPGTNYISDWVEIWQTLSQQYYIQIIMYKNSNIVYSKNTTAIIFYI